MSYSKMERDPWEKPYAAIVPRISGSISAVSSTVIIYVILRSRPKLSTVYHRIMFGLSVADICASLAMALTSLPMPSSMPFEEEFGYHWAGTRLGNTYTCNAQGFFAFAGTTTVFGYNTALCVYYFFAIGVGVKERQIKKYIEPVLHGMPILLGLVCGVLPLFFDLYNPSVTTVAWCFVQPYPNECYTWQEHSCVRGKKASHLDVFIKVGLFILFLNTALIVLSLIAVFVRTRRTEFFIRAVLRRMYRMQRAQMSNLESRYSSKVVLIQSCAYVCAFMTVLLPPYLRMTNPMGAKFDSNTIVRFDKAILVLYPLQGFYNVLIFISHKIYIRMIFDKELTIKGALLSLICHKQYIEPCYISRMTIVKANHVSNHRQESSGGDEIDENIFELYLENENGEQIVLGTQNSDQNDAVIESVEKEQNMGGPNTSQSKTDEFIDKESSKLPTSGSALSGAAPHDIFSYPSSNSKSCEDVSSAETAGENSGNKTKKRFYKFYTVPEILESFNKYSDASGVNTL